MEWKPASVEIVRTIVQRDLADCDDEQTATFGVYGVEPYLAPIMRYGGIEEVVVVAGRGGEVIYWEDVEEGFNASPVSADGRILEHRCNQDNLGLALNGWIEGRTRPPGAGPALPIG